MNINDVSSEKLKQHLSEAKKLILIGLLLGMVGSIFSVVDFFIALEFKDNSAAKIQFYTFFIITVLAAGMTVKTFIKIISLWLHTLWIKLELLKREKP